MCWETLLSYHSEKLQSSVINFASSLAQMTFWKEKHKIPLNETEYLLTKIWNRTLEKASDSFKKNSLLTERNVRDIFIHLQVKVLKLPFVFYAQSRSLASLVIVAVVIVLPTRTSRNDHVGPDAEKRICLLTSLSRLRANHRKMCLTFNFSHATRVSSFLTHFLFSHTGGGKRGKTATE